MVLFVSIFQTDVGLYSIYNNMRKNIYIVPTSSPDPMKPCGSPPKHAWFCYPGHLHTNQSTTSWSFCTSQEEDALLIARGKTNSSRNFASRLRCHGAGVPPVWWDVRVIWNRNGSRRCRAAPVIPAIKRNTVHVTQHRPRYQQWGSD